MTGRAPAGAAILDLHAHYVAPELIDVLAREGARHGIDVRDEADGCRRAVLGDRPAGLPFLPALSDVDTRLAWMDRAGIACELVAGWMDLAGYHLDKSAGAWLARQQNEALADLVRAHAERFVGAAMVPLQAPELAARELRHAIGALGLKAVQIGTNVDGKVLDEPELDIFWAAAQELGMPIIVHPAELGGPQRFRRYFLHILVGNPCETTLAAGGLLLGGVLERFPDLRVLLVHGGGFLPYQLGRLARGFTAAPPAFGAKATRAPDAFLRQLYFDTVLHDPRALGYLIATVGAGQVVVGTDYPFPLRDGDPRGSLGKLSDLTEADRAAIERENACRLLDLERRS